MHSEFSSARLQPIFGRHWFPVASQLQHVYSRTSKTGKLSSRTLPHSLRNKSKLLHTPSLRQRNAAKMSSCPQFISRRYWVEQNKYKIGTVNVFFKDQIYAYLNLVYCSIDLVSSSRSEIKHLSIVDG